MVATAMQSTRGPGDALRAGDEVEVRNRFDRHWVGGFALHAVVGGAAGTRYRIRRHSDGAVLPALFDTTDVRRRGTSGSGTFSPFG